MEIEIEKIVLNVLIIPSQFYKLGNISVVDLLKESGYFKEYDKIYSDSLKEALANHKEYINDWVVFSESRRSDSGYYLNQNNNNNYNVGYLENGNIVVLFEFSEIIDACATFIKRYIEDLRTRST